MEGNCSGNCLCNCCLCLPFAQGVLPAAAGRSRITPRNDLPCNAHLSHKASNFPFGAYTSVLLEGNGAYARVLVLVGSAYAKLFLLGESAYTLARFISAKMRGAMSHPEKNGGVPCHTQKKLAGCKCTSLTKMRDAMSHPEKVGGVPCHTLNNLAGCKCTSLIKMRGAMSHPEQFGGVPCHTLKNLAGRKCTYT